MRIYITKYALTQGILERDGEPREPDLADKEPRMVEIIRTTGEYSNWYAHKPDWHLTKTEAIARAETMRSRKIATLKRQLAKLEKMRFE